MLQDGDAPGVIFHASAADGAKEMAAAKLNFRSRSLAKHHGKVKTKYDRMALGAFYLHALAEHSKDVRLVSPYTALSFIALAAAASRTGYVACIVVLLPTRTGCWRGEEGTHKTDADALHPRCTSRALLAELGFTDASMQSATTYINSTKENEEEECPQRVPQTVTREPLDAETCSVACEL